MSLSPVALLKSLLPRSLFLLKSLKKLKISILNELVELRIERNSALSSNRRNWIMLQPKPPWRGLCIE
jgi:hypothetical protein